VLAGESPPRQIREHINQQTRSRQRKRKEPLPFQSHNPLPPKPPPPPLPPKSPACERVSRPSDEPASTQNERSRPHERSRIELARALKPLGRPNRISASPGPFRQSPRKSACERVRSKSTHPRALKTNKLARASGREQSFKEASPLSTTRSPHPSRHPHPCSALKHSVRAGKEQSDEPASTQNNKLDRASGREQSFKEASKTPRSSPAPHRNRFPSLPASKHSVRAGKEQIDAPAST
jgi:hypothetical protein